MAYKKLLLWSILFLGLISIGLGQEKAEQEYPYSILFLTFRDLHTNEIIGDYPISISFENLQYDIKQIRFDYLKPDGVYRYQLSTGPWRVKAWFDNRSTPEPDYYAEGSFTIEEEEFVANRTLYVLPVGTVDGTVVDKSNKLVSGAELQFTCKSKFDISYPETTNQFGSFLAESVPVGICKISAAYEKAVGTVEADVKQGELTTVTINLDQPLLTSGINYLYIAAALIAIAAIGFVYHKKGHPFKIRDKVREKAKQVRAKKLKTVKLDLKEAKKEEKAEEKEEKTEEEELNPRARDVLKTLNEKETAIVNVLLASENKGTQAAIRNETGIPKTTLARLFQGLEAKNIIKVQKVGKLKKIELTEWFLGND